MDVQLFTVAVRDRSRNLKPKTTTKTCDLLLFFAFHLAMDSSQQLDGGNDTCPVFVCETSGANHDAAHLRLVDLIAINQHKSQQKKTFTKYAN